MCHIIYEINSWKSKLKYYELIHSCTCCVVRGGDQKGTDSTERLICWSAVGTEVINKTQISVIRCTNLRSLHALEVLHHIQDVARLATSLGLLSTCWFTSQLNRWGFLLKNWLKIVALHTQIINKIKYMYLHRVLEDSKENLKWFYDYIYSENFTNVLLVFLVENLLLPSIVFYKIMIWYPTTRGK